MKRIEIYIMCLMTDELDTYYRYREMNKCYLSWKKDDRMRVRKKWNKYKENNICKQL